jgi:hypothetical protein
MKWILLGVCVVGVVAWWLNRWDTRRHEVSPDWLIDNQRRVWGSGVDQVSWAWPVKKQINEASEFNRHRLRKRA